VTPDCVLQQRAKDKGYSSCVKTMRESNNNTMLSREDRKTEVEVTLGCVLQQSVRRVKGYTSVCKGWRRMTRRSNNQQSEDTKLYNRRTCSPIKDRCSNVRIDEAYWSVRK
jgi:hypothetical protein